jgi:hypothetical protein
MSEVSVWSIKLMSLPLDESTVLTVGYVPFSAW